MAHAVMDWARYANPRPRFGVFVRRIKVYGPGAKSRWAVYDETGYESVLVSEHRTRAEAYRARRAYEDARFARKMNPVSDEEIERIIAEQDRRAAEKAEFGATVWSEFERSGIVVLPMRPQMPGTRVSLTHSTYPGVKYQVTRWDEQGAFGHRDAQNQKGVTDEMWEWAGMTGWRGRWEQRERVK